MIMVFINFLYSFREMIFYFIGRLFRTFRLMSLTTYINISLSNTAFALIVSISHNLTFFTRIVTIIHIFTSFNLIVSCISSLTSFTFSYFSIPSSLKVFFISPFCCLECLEKTWILVWIVVASHEIPLSSLHQSSPFYAITLVPQNYFVLLSLLMFWGISRETIPINLRKSFL